MNTLKINSGSRSGSSPVHCLTDEQLLLRYRELRDGDAFSELVRRYEQPLSNYLQRYLADPWLAQDVFQSTFLQVHRRMHLYKKGRTVRPWLYAIATHLAIDFLRKSRGQRMVSLDTPHVTESGDVGAFAHSLESKAPGPVSHMEETERREWVQAALRKLPASQRSLLVLIYYGGLRFREVAQMLGVPAGTVKSRVHTALAVLRNRSADPFRHDSPDLYPAA